jgi:Xaa-Pro aminopeptidase
VHPNCEPDLVVPLLEQEHMRKVGGFKEIKTYFEYPAAPKGNWYDKLNELISGVQNLGVEPSATMEITSKLKTQNIIPCNLIGEMRLVKTEDEIEMIRNAARYADLGMKGLIKSFYKGISVVELFSQSRSIQLSLIKSGVYDPLNSEFLTVGWPSSKSAQPHGVPVIGDRLVNGSMVMVCALRVNGYAAECERTIYGNLPTDDEKELFGHMKRAGDIALSMVRPGIPCAEIDGATQNYFESQGLSKYVLHRTGHGFGLGNHEPPWISIGSKDVLENNMVISIEPGLYVPGIGGFRHSDTVLVTESGHECLTKYPTSIEELTLNAHYPLKALKGAFARHFLGI